MRRYFSFSGRARRKTFWLTHLALMVIGAVPLLFLALLLGVAGALGGETAAATGSLASTIAWGALFVIVSVVVTIVSLAVTVRRLHDLNRSGWWILGYYVVSFVLSFAAQLTAVQQAGDTIASLVLALAGSVLGLAFLIYVGFIRGTHGGNRFGPDPKWSGL